MAIQSNPTIDNSSQQAKYRRPSVLMHSLTLAMMIGVSALGLTACDKSKDDAADESAQISKDGSVEDNSAVEVNTQQQPPSIDSNSAENTQDEQAVPVSYDVNNWQVGSEDRYELSELKKIQKALGSVVSTDKNSLDYTSNPAIKYRFMNDSQPYLDVIDSQDYLEFGWYYANPTDSDSEKQTSIEHAKSVYKVAHNLMGKEGTSLVGNILTGQVIKNKTVGGKKVELAKCEFYSCMIIFEK